MFYIIINMFANGFINDLHRQYPFEKVIPLEDKPYPINIQMFGFPHVNYDLTSDIYAQLKLFQQTLQSNHTITLGLIEKIDAVSHRLNDINLLISTQKAKTQEPSESETAPKKTFSEDPYLETKIRCDDLMINKVFGKHNYKYELKLSEGFDKTLYKERNFKLTIKLIDSKGDVIINSNRIPISFNAYYDEENPQLIESTRLMAPIFKGNNESEIHQGKGSLAKLQFKEVSSYYSTKGIFFVMYAKPNSINYNNSSNYNERNIDFNMIRPLIISDIIVKAKKK